MNLKDCLMDELKRLNRMNDKSEKNINTGNYSEDEPEQIVNNVKAMCEIANTIGRLHFHGVI